MPSVEELRSLVERLKESGVGEEDIRKTLEEMEVGEDVINSLLGSPTDVPEPPPPDEENVEIEEPESVIDAEPLERVVEEQELLETSEKVEEVKRSVELLKEEVPSKEEVRSLRERLEEIERKINDIDARLYTLEKVMKDILDTTRTLLVELYRKTR